MSAELKAWLTPVGHSGDNPFIRPCACDREGSAPGRDASCGPKLILSREEEAILAAMRRIRQLSAGLRVELRRLADDDGAAFRRQHLAAMIHFYRKRFNREREELAHANRVKHLRLGHLDVAGETVRE